MNKALNTVYLIVGESGEYEQRSWAPIVTFSTREEAEYTAKNWQEKVDQYVSEYDAWCKSRVGARPEFEWDIEYYRSYTVVEVPLK